MLDYIFRKSSRKNQIAMLNFCVCPAGVSSQINGKYLSSIEMNCSILYD